MTPCRSLRHAVLAAAIVAALPGVVAARELGNFDVTVRPDPAATVGGKQSGAGERGGPGRDALGRETFTWVQQALPTAAKQQASHGPEGAARAHLLHLVGHAKGGGDVVDTLDLRKIDRQSGGAMLVHFIPRIDGVAIFNEDLAMLLDGEQRLIAMRGPLPRTPAAAAKSLPAFALDAVHAVAAALGAHDFERTVVKRIAPTTIHGEYQQFELDRSVRSESGALSAGGLRAKPVYFRTASGLLPAWYVETQVADDPKAAADSYGFVISAVDGAVLFRINQTAHATAHTYRVWAEDSPERTPLPGPLGRALMPDPDGLSTDDTAPFAAQELRTLASAPFSRSDTDGWLAPDATVTRGNNVNAYVDLVAPDGLDSGDLQPSLGVTGFDYPFNSALAPSDNPTQRLASAVQLFYWTNWLHDWFYDHGFTESDGNAQQDNFSRGGLGGDPIRAEAQDYNVIDNATMSTPADGWAPRMQMGLSSAPSTKDRTLDGRTTAHEWAHYLSHRLVGDARGLNTEHAGGMGEGWSDFVGLLATVKDEDRQKPGNDAFQGAYGSPYSAHSYYGVRRYPYSTDLAKNPLSLRHIAEGEALPTSPAPRGSGSGFGNSNVHPQGEIWASALWDAYVSLLNDRPRLSFADAQARMKDYLVGGLKLTPVSPTMTEARDAILATILANGRQEDFALVSAAFAKRGLGAGAFIPDRYSDDMIGTVESKALGGDVAVTSSQVGLPLGCDADSILDVGESAQMTLTLRNTGFTALEPGTVTLASSNPALVFPSGSSVAFPGLPLFGSTTISFPVALATSVAPNSRISVTATPTAPGIQSPPGIAGTRVLSVNLDEAVRTSTTENFDTGQTNWSKRRDPLGAGNGTWTNGIDANMRFLHGADTHLRSVAWAESPSMSIGTGPLTLNVRHRFKFESSGGVEYDGGIIQVSTDGGTSWSPIDPAAAGYGAVALSDCCGNPLAGQRGYVGQSVFFPDFADTVVNLGTAYANQPAFRLRVGVATDASVNAYGWDIDRIIVTGLTDTPFNAVVEQAASCSVASGKDLQGAMSGTWYDPDRSGDGVLVDFGKVGETPVVFFSWYTYAHGEQQWLVGSNVFDTAAKSVTVDLINSSGTGFGSAFRAEDVVRSPWGSVAMSFPDCDTMQLTYQQTGGESGTLTLARGLERLADGQCSLLQGGRTGTYYAEARSGEGVLVDFGRVGSTPVEFLSWYTYEQGEQQWLVGSQVFGATDESVEIELMKTRGASFGQAFRASDVERLPWGSVTQRFLDCETIELTYRKTGGESGTLVMNRGLERLGDGQCR